MKHVFGPVPSRRLGKSLGIDPVPLKTCNWNCVYCQLGRSRPLVNERAIYFPPEDILVEVNQALASHKPGEIDWVTLVGSGETCLYAEIGWLIRQVKTATQLPVAVITNGSLLYLPEVRQALSPADAVLPSLDAGTPELYRQVNRPHPAATFEHLLDGLVRFRQEYQGQLWVEVMMVQGLNDTEEALRDLAVALKLIQPDQVHILQPTRSPAESWVKPADEAALLRAMAILGNAAEVIHPAASGEFDLSGYDTLWEAVIGIITRHPMQEAELIKTLEHWSPGKVAATLAELEKSGKAQRIQRYGEYFWSASSAYFPAEKQGPPKRPKPAL
jgi:wyosine [tRNA(Phe)-imidazoG37] synthetase (radical SAM superfamily)